MIFIKRTIKYISLALLAILVPLFIWLYIGISINNLKVKNIELSNLTFKLEEKFVVTVDKVELPKTSKHTSSDIRQTVKKVLKYLKPFKKIAINNLIIDNNSFSISIDHTKLNISNSQYSVLLFINNSKKDVNIDVLHILDKKNNISMYGDLKYKFESNSLEFNLKSKEFDSLEPIVEIMNLNSVVRDWTLNRVQANSYKLLSLNGELEFINNDLSLKENSLKAQVEFYGVKIFFHTELEPILSDSFVLSYANDTLDFKLKRPIYRNKDLSGSLITINNLTQDNSALDLKIKMNTRFDYIMTELLNAYDVELPLKQDIGSLDTTFYATIPFSDEPNSYVVDVTLGDGDIYINDFKLNTKSGQVNYANSIVKLDDIEVKNDIHGGIVNGNVKLDNKVANLLYDVEYLNIGTKGEEFFKLSNKSLNLKLDYNLDTTLSILDLKSQIIIDDNTTTIKIDDVNKVKPYVSSIENIMEAGNIVVNTKDFKNYAFKGKIKRLACIFYEREEACKAIIPFSGLKSQDNLEISVFGDSLNYNKQKELMKIKDLNIDLKKVSDLVKENSSDTQHKMVILGENSHFRYEDYSLRLDTYDIELKNGVVKAMGSSNGDILNFYKYKNIVSIEALRVKDSVLHPLINFKGLKDGRYTIKNKGNIDTTMEGTIIIEGGVMKDFKSYNNTLAFINTVPSLVLLQDPGYSSTGFRITNGIIDYKLIENKKIIFKSIYIEGKSANITGIGEIDLEAKTIKLKLAVKVVRDLGSVIGAVPLVGYILLGEDKSLTIGFDISGSLDDPEVQISTVEDILVLPIRAIERLLKSPAHLLGLDLNEQEQEK